MWREARAGRFYCVVTVLEGEGQQRHSLQNCVTTVERQERHTRQTRKEIRTAAIDIDINLAPRVHACVERSPLTEFQATSKMICDQAYFTGSSEIQNGCVSSRQTTCFWFEFQFVCCDAVCRDVVCTYKYTFAR